MGAPSPASYSAKPYSDPPAGPHRDGAHRVAGVCLGALGVVFGDIGTSPLYALRECFHGAWGIAVTPQNILGVLSLVFWSLLIIVSIKYILLVLRADNEGEGGIMALTSLLMRKDGGVRKASPALMALGLFGACVLYGDGMITPAISVLSAVEGLQVMTPALKPFIIPVTLFILAGLFGVQRRGTAWVGRLFGPVLLVWFLVLAILGAAQILRTPEILAAVNPCHALTFLLENGRHGFWVLGAVFLVVTGCEALYADLGHFSRKPIQMTWGGLVLPSLLLNYFGQGALLMAKPEQAVHPFYGLVPPWALAPMVLLATLATIIASQALITGTFSLTQQAIQLGYLPRLRITHTSSALIGQIYIAPVNWFLMVCTIGLVIGFESSSRLAAAYGLAVSSTMLVTTILFCIVVRKRWGWPSWIAGALLLFLMSIEVPFFAANLAKLLHGGWFAFVIAVAIYFLMRTWKRGRQICKDQVAMITSSFEAFQKQIETRPPQRVKGRAIYLTGNPDAVPTALIHNLNHYKVMHAEIALLHFRTRNIPRVPNFQKIELERMGGGFSRVIANRGFMEEPKIDTILRLARDKGLEFRVEDTSFFLGREKMTLGHEPTMGRFRSNLFIFMSRNSMDAASYFAVPPERVVEVGICIEL